MRKVLRVCSFLFSMCLPVVALAQTTIRVNAGGPAYRDSKGQSWSADYGFNTGSLSHSAPSATVIGTSAPFLFKSARVGVATTPDLQYQFAVANGLYKVNLYFAETYYKQAGSRVFDVQMQGATVFGGVDIFAQTGFDHALVKSAQISVTNGQIVVRFAHRANANVPIISAIEILPSGTLTAPSVTVQPTSLSIPAGQLATFKVVAAGTAPLSYQWQKNGIAIRGATSTTYTTPPATSSDNGDSFRVAISNSVGKVMTAAATLRVTSLPTVLTGSLPGAAVGKGYSTTLQASGGKTPYSWSISSGSLPADLTLSGSGQISGIPTAAGTSSFAVKVTDSSSPAQTATVSLSIAITAAVSTLQITTSSVPAAQEGASYSATLSATGGTTPYSWSVPAGSLPAGLSLSTSGVLSGTPTASGIFGFTVKVQRSGSPAETATATLELTVNSTSSNNCPTGQPCGVTAPYCEAYTPPSTSSATDILTLPVGYGGAFLITAPGNYYLSSDVSRLKSGIAVLSGGGSVDINLNGHSLTYGTTADGSGTSQIGEYGILICNTGNLGSERLNSSYATNGLCRNGGMSASNVTIENGTITQSPNASQYYDPSNCPGSGVNNGCAHPHDSIASHAIFSLYSSGTKIKHLTITTQNVDSRPIMYQYQQPGAGMDIECNTINDKVRQLNQRAEAHAAVWSGNDNSGTNGDMIQYNTIVGSPQNGIALGVGGSETPGSIVQYNDINVGYYQMPPQVSSGEMYSNDYALGVCMRGGTVQYNYIHSANSRGIGCIFGGDQNNERINNNYVSAGEFAVNGEYGPNGQRAGAAWVGGCEIDGGRGFEAKDSFAMQLYSNTLIENVSECGAGGIVLVEMPCQSISCPSTATHPFSIHDNAIQINNTTGSSTLLSPQDAACYILDTVQGNYSNYFSPSLRDSCTSDGDYVTTDGYDPGDYFSFINPTYSMGSHPLSSDCGGSGGSYCGHMMHWQGQQGPPSQELGFVFQDVRVNSGAGLTFAGDPGTPLARSATVKWTYTVTVQNLQTLAPIAGATVTASDAGSTQLSCTTNSSGMCSLELTEETVSSPAGNPALSTTRVNSHAIAISATGCVRLNFNLDITGITAETHTLNCQ